MPQSLPRVAVLVSGAGSNLAAILDARSRIRADFRLCVSSVPGARALDHATAAGLHTVAIDRATCSDRADFDAAMQRHLDEHAIDFLVLAGFMRILTDDFVERWRGRMVNIHPSLLPAFPGLHAQRQALRAGVRVAGCSVHFVEPGAVDGGPILAQAAVPVFEGDDEASLAARIREQEHRLYPAVLERLFDGRFRYEQGRVVGVDEHASVPITG